MPSPWFLLFVVFPVLEIASIIAVTSWVGGAATFTLIIVSAVIGLLVMRHAGRSWWTSLRTSVGRPDEQGVSTPVRVPDATLAADRGLLFLAGLLLAIPGFIGDVIGLLLILPITRSLVRVGVAGWFVRRFVAVTGPGGSTIWRSRRSATNTVRVERVDEAQPREGRSGPVIRGEILPPDDEDGSPG
jgi:UPF0716 protein FxsA